MASAPHQDTSGATVSCTATHDHSESVESSGTCMSRTTAETARFVNTVAHGLENYIAEKFFSVPAVIAVAFHCVEGVLYVWTILDSWEPEPAARVYDLELETMDQFVGVAFDFYVVGAEGKPIESLLTPKTAYVIRRPRGPN